MKKDDAMFARRRDLSAPVGAFGSAAVSVEAGVRGWCTYGHGVPIRWRRRSLVCAAVSAPYIGKDTAGSWTIRSAFHFDGRAARKNLGKTAWQLRRGVVASGYVRGDDELRRYEILRDFVGGGDIIYRLDKKKE